MTSESKETVRYSATAEDEPAPPSPPPPLGKDTEGDDLQEPPALQRLVEIEGPKCEREQHAHDDGESAKRSRFLNALRTTGGPKEKQTRSATP